MIRVTYRLIMDAPNPHRTGNTLVRFSTGMEISAAVSDLEKLADCLDATANGGCREIRRNDGATLTICRENNAVHLKSTSISGVRTIDLSEPMAQQLSADLRMAHREIASPAAGSETDDALTRRQAIIEFE
jgi:hypothetical protein